MVYVKKGDMGEMEGRMWGEEMGEEWGGVGMEVM